MQRWDGLRILILGVARQGIALAQYLVRHGAVVVVNDRRSDAELAAARQALAEEDAAGRVTWVLGGHPSSALDGVDLVCVSGGVPLTLSLVQEAQQRGIGLSNDSQIFLEAAPCPVIGITGSAGKTTTTALVGKMAEECVKQSQGSGPNRAWVGGNIGNPLISVVDEMQAGDLAVMELSSFQLEIMTRAPQVAAVLNITPNHLDRHPSMEAYTQAKARILDFQVQDGVAVLNRDDPGAWALASHVRGSLVTFGLSQLPAGQVGGFLRGQEICLRLTGGAGKPVDVGILPRSEVRLRGEHNLQNVVAACTIAAAAGLPVAAMHSAVENFTGVAHRLEYVREWRASKWYNDSIATAPERAMAAIRAFDEPLVLLAGGRDKNLPWEDFARLVCSRVKHVVLFGEASGIIDGAIRHAAGQGQAGALVSVTCCPGLQQAVWQASQLAMPGDVVLLSPGCTSFDEFTDFEERGKCFVQWVNEIA
jgi:UDP-N-acetylmuramoylalanine--D-glutamate ligase